MDNDGPTLHSAQGMSRREFARSAGRYVLLGGLAVLAAALWRRPPAANRESCAGDGICTRCPDLDDCGHPQALSARQRVME